MKQNFFGAIVALGLFVAASPALALDLHEARSQGIVGEKADGYVAALKKTPETEALVADVNQKRRDEYARISKANNQPVDVVAKIAAEKIINGLNAGESYQDSSGNWKTHK